MRQLVRDTLTLPGRELVIECPADAFELFRRFYPHSWKGAAAGAADFSLAADGDRWHLRHGERTTGPLRGARQAVFALEYEVQTSLVARCHDRIALHAAGIEVAGRAHLIAGDPDSGKSTSTFQLVELGHGFLCEEIALVDPHTLAVEPHLRTLGLDTGYLDEFASQRPIEHGEVDRLDDRLARYSPRKVSLEPARLATVFLPRFRPGRGRYVEVLDPGDALPEILGYCFTPNVEEEIFFDRVIGVLESCRIVRVQFDAIATARELWQDLLPLGDWA